MVYPDNGHYGLFRPYNYVQDYTFCLFTQYTVWLRVLWQVASIINLPNAMGLKKFEPL